MHQTCSHIDLKSSLVCVWLLHGIPVCRDMCTLATVTKFFFCKFSFIREYYGRLSRVYLLQSLPIVKFVRGINWRTLYGNNCLSLSMHAFSVDKMLVCFRRVKYLIWETRQTLIIQNTALTCKGIVFNWM